MLKGEQEGAVNYKFRGPEMECSCVNAALDGVQEQKLALLPKTGV